MKFTSCPTCAYPHNPAVQCPPGRRRRYEIAFPAWVKVTRCEFRRQSRFFASRHGWTRFEIYAITPYGYEMELWRRRDALAAVDAIDFPDWVRAPIVREMAR